jgi:hypothetical protein
MALRKSLTLDEPAPSASVQEPVPERASQQKQPIGKAPRPASREGKLQFAGYLTVTAKRQIDVYAAMNGISGQQIFEEMVDDWFAKHGLHRLAKDKT